MTDKKQRETRRAQQAREIEENQSALRQSIAESQRPIDNAVEITRRHRRENEETSANRGRSGSEVGSPLRPQAIDISDLDGKSESRPWRQRRGLALG